MKGETTTGPPPSFARLSLPPGVLLWPRPETPGEEEPVTTFQLVPLGRGGRRPLTGGQESLVLTAINHALTRCLEVRVLHQHLVSSPLSGVSIQYLSMFFNRPHYCLKKTLCLILQPLIDLLKIIHCHVFLLYASGATHRNSHRTKKKIVLKYQTGRDCRTFFKLQTENVCVHIYLYTYKHLRIDLEA